MKFVSFVSVTRSEDNGNNPGGGVYVSASIDIVTASTLSWSKFDQDLKVEERRAIERMRESEIELEEKMCEREKEIGLESNGVLHSFLAS